MNMQSPDNARAIWDAVRHLPYFKVMTIVFDHEATDIEIEASGDIGSDRYNEDSIILLIKQGMQQSATLLIRQYAPDPDISLAKLAEPDEALVKRILNGTPLHSLLVRGALLVPGGCVPMPADALEESYRPEGYEGKMIYKNFVDCLE